MHFKYLNILLTIVKWNSLGSDWNLAHIQTLNIIYGLEVVKYKCDPIIPLKIVCAVFLFDIHYISQDNMVMSF